MRTTTQAAAHQLRESNPVPQDAFIGAASDGRGRATFENIAACSAVPSAAPGRPVSRPGRSRAGAVARAGTRFSWRLAGPAIAVVTAAALVTAVTMSGTSAAHRPRGMRLLVPGGAPAYRLAAVFHQLGALYSAHPGTGHGNGSDALHQLAVRAAGQPTPALRPVWYSARRLWEDVGGNTPRNLSFFSRRYFYEQAWHAESGRSAASITQVRGGTVVKVLASDFASGAGVRQLVAWANPATLPTDPAAMRRHLLHPPGGISRGHLSLQVIIYTSAIFLLDGEPLPPAARAALLNVLAEVAASPGPGYRWVNLGAITDRIGRAGVAIASEQANSGGPHIVGLNILIFDPHTGALLDSSDAQCGISLGTIPAASQCYPTDYREFVAAKAVPRVPRFPAHLPWLYDQAGSPWSP